MDFEIDNEQSPKITESDTDIDRREFLGTAAVGAAALSASVVAGTSNASAQTPAYGELPTIDWKTIEAGPSANDLYAPQGGFNDTDVTWWPGRNISGLTIGLIQFQANLPMIPGNMGNATTFDFPMLYRQMNVENVMEVMSPTPIQTFTDACVEAAQWLEMQGVRAIMGNCGFFAHYQIVVRSALTRRSILPA